MKNLLTLALILFVFCTSCDDDKEVTATDLPQTAKTYIETHFTSTQITKVVKDDDDADLDYEVVLNNGVRLVFDQNGICEDIESTSKLPDSVIPPSILDYIQINYADQHILEWEKDLADQEIKLSNGKELKFDLSGKFLRIDN